MSAISSLQTAASNIQFSEATNKSNRKSSDDFAAVLQSAMNAKQQIVDTYESTTSANSQDDTNKNEQQKTVSDNALSEAQMSTPEEDKRYREVFHQFVGQTMYGQMLKSMRETQQKPAYFHGGRAEEIFQSQFDQVIVEKMTAATPNSFSENMFKQMKN